MTDLVSSLADSILALINAKPRSPTKDEIVEVLSQHPNVFHPILTVHCAGHEPILPSGGDEPQAIPRMEVGDTITFTTSHPEEKAWISAFVTDWLDHEVIARVAAQRASKIT